MNVYVCVLLCVKHVCYVKNVQFLNIFLYCFNWFQEHVRRTVQLMFLSYIFIVSRTLIQSQ